MFDQTEYVSSSRGEQVITLTNVDWELMLEQYDVEVYAWYGGYAFQATNEIFRPYIDKWTRVKIESGREGNLGMRQIAKLKLNSLYGKFATRPQVLSRRPVLQDGVVRYVDLEPEEREPVYLPVGVFTTAYGRAYTIRFAQSAGDRSDPPPGAHVDDFALGAWGHDGAFSRFKALRAKAYVYEDAETGKLNVHCSGMPASCYGEVTMENFNIGAVYNGKLYQHRTKGGIYFTEDTFKIQPKRRMMF